MEPEHVAWQPLVTLRALHLDVLAGEPEMKMKLVERLELELAINASASLAAVLFNMVVQVKHRVVGVLAF